MRVLVTGANGFVGRHLVADLQQAGHEPILLDLQPEPFRPDVAYHRADLCDAAAVADQIAAIKPDGCIHLAGLAFVPAADKDPALAFTVNTLGTINLLAAFRQTDPAKRVVVVTSGQVYGYKHGGSPIGEDQPLQPQNIYAVTKAAADEAALLHAQTLGMQVMTARPNNHIGPGQSHQFVGTAFARQILAIQHNECEPVMNVGNLESRRDFLDVRDVARAYRLLLESGHSGEAYNIASGKLTTIQVLLDELCRLANVQPRIEIDNKLFRPADDGPVLDISKITDHTGWRPEIPLEKTLLDIMSDIDAGQ